MNAAFDFVIGRSMSFFHHIMGGGSGTATSSGGAGGERAAVTLGKASTAKEVVDMFAPGKGLAGKVAIVTGGNSGIGLETVKALSYAGCRVIMGSRSVEGGVAAVKTEVAEQGHGGYVGDAGSVVVKQLDLMDLKSIKAFADEVAKEPRLDYLVFNAGIMAAPHTLSPNGWESQIATNHFGHCHLFSLLRDKMVGQTHPSRVVVLASTAHTMGSVDVADLHYSKGRDYSSWGAYGQSKKANILFAKSLADQLKSTQVCAVSCHPGVINTNLQRFLPSFVSFLIGVLVTDKTIPQGAATTVYGCLCPDVVAGSYLSDCAAIEPDAEAADTSGALRAALWKATEEQLKEAIAKNNL
jgi:retinol dehydrogenase-13